VRQLREHGIQLQRDLLVIDFLGEESNDFGLSCLGSRALAGELRAADLDRRDFDGTRLGDRYDGFGLDPSDVLTAAVHAAKWRPQGYVELHVEQGPQLEERNVPIGVVTAIAGIERLLATFIGRPDHAGTMPMGDRRDALVAAAEAVLAVRRTGCGAPVHGVATTSRLVSEPGSPNVVPGTVRMLAEMRSVDTGWLSTAQRRLTEEIREKAATFDVDVEVTWSRDNECRLADASIQGVLLRHGGLARHRLGTGAQRCDPRRGSPVAALPDGNDLHSVASGSQPLSRGVVGAEPRRHRDPGTRGDADRARPRRHRRQ
jgi:N-carbamoyl-L-amino-acid hydrolase